LLEKERERGERERERQKVSLIVDCCQDDNDGDDMVKKEKI